LKGADLKPHLVHSWFTPELGDRLDGKVGDLNYLYRHAQNLEKQGERVVSTDEMTGVQALARKHLDLPEFEYICRNTRSLIVNFEVGSGL
jgi:hypothetical protein